MKYKIIKYAALIILFCTLYANLHSQDVQTLPPITVTSSSNVTEKVTESFNSFFKDAYDQRWFKADKNFLVKFMASDQKNTALFKKNGNLIYHISYGHEKDLPAEIRKLVKSNYVDFSITSAIKVEQDDRKIWVVNLEDAKKLILVRVENEELEEVASYDKD